MSANCIRSGNPVGYMADIDAKNPATGACVGCGRVVTFKIRPILGSPRFFWPNHKENRS